MTIEFEPSDPLQVAEYAALTVDSELITLFGGPVRCYDIIPRGAAFPYFSIGDVQIADNGNACSKQMFIAFSTTHIWSRPEEPVGRWQAKQIASRALRVLLALTTVEGFKIDGVDLDQLIHLRDPDGLTAHSVLTMRYVLTAI